MEEDGVEYSGKTVDDAIAAAEADLGVDRDDLAVEVITPGSRGVFGIGAEDARIRARRLRPSPTPPGPVEAPPPQAAPDAEDAHVADQAAASRAEPEQETETAPSAPPAALNGAELSEEATEVLRELLDTMGFDAEVSVRSDDEPVVLEIQGDNLGVLIGRRGDNLSALQFMVNLILSRGRRQWPRIVIDVENYRSRREESLRSLAERTAYRVQRNGRPFTLEAMPASDRRIIHLSLRDRPDVETYSIGEGAARRVVIAPKRPARSQASRERY